jgi:NCAIR mutase (PurE)-related protein
MREVLEKLRDGKVSIEEAESLLRLNSVEEIEHAALDLQRESRTGVPEIIMGEGKTPDQLMEIVSTFLTDKGRAIVTRASEEQITTIQAALGDRYELRVDKKAGIIVARRQGAHPPSVGRKVGIMTGGTSDVVVAEEARTIAEEMGCEVITAYDVGIAGFHRHIKPLKRMLQEGVDAIVVVAGMEGALPSVIASLVHVPVIGVPTSVGYGFGAGGVGALTTMLQSCSPGMCVVNIDNGIGAGALAALIAHQVARALHFDQAQYKRPALEEDSR